MARTKKTLAVSLWLGLATMSVSLPATSSVSIALTVDDVARDASLIIRATPVQEASEWESGRIVTTTVLRVDRVIAGPAPAPGEVRVRSLGGTVGDVAQLVEGEPQLSPKLAASSILFLKQVGGSDDSEAARFVVSGRAQGQLMVARAPRSSQEVVRLVRMGTLLPKHPLAPPRLVAHLDGADIAEVTAEAARAWERAHASR